MLTCLFIGPVVEYSSLTWVSTHQEERHRCRECPAQVSSLGDVQLALYKQCYSDVEVPRLDNHYASHGH